MKQAIVTTSWDDGHILDIKLADLLKKYGIKGTFYISPRDEEFLNRDLLSDEQIKILGRDFEIGAHTMTHRHLSTITDDEVKSEVSDSKDYLEKILRKEIVSFCYPSGDYLEKHKEIVKGEGFILARTVKRFKTQVGSDLYGMPTTVHVYRHWSDILPIYKAAGFLKFIKAYFNWDELAIILFEKAKNESGVFHLWGHSWEIEKNNDWSRLERVLQHISKRSDVKYATNSELV